MPYTREDKIKFVQTIHPDVMRIFKGSGLPVRLVLGMAVVETGWGEKIVGKSSKNLFNIKAFDNWKGKSVFVEDALEYEMGKDGKMKAITEPSYFRVYGSYADSIKDLRRLLTTAPRYVNAIKGVSSKNDIKMLADAIQEAGYATNVGYGGLIKDIVGGPTFKKGLSGLSKIDTLTDKELERLESQSPPPPTSKSLPFEIKP